MIIPLLLKHKMHMTRPKRMAMQLLQQLPDRPIMRNRVRHRRNRLKPKHARVITAHDTAAIGAVPIRILHVIVARGVRLPDIDLHVGDGVAVGIFERADDEERLAFGVVGHAVTVGHHFGFVRVEGAEDCTFGRAGGFGVVD